MKTPYSYSLLRYVHDVVTGEALNVGVVLHAPAARDLSARIQTKYGRLTRAFPKMNGDLHRDLMRGLQAAFDTAAVRYAEEPRFSATADTLENRLHEVLRPDDSSLQWSAAGGGLTSDPAMELESLYQRMVAINESDKARHGRTDDEVWGLYRAPLQRAKVLPHLTPHRVVTALDEIEFSNAWRNGAWHCLHPLSLDLIKPESIREKAHTLIGQMTGVRSAMSGNHLYLMLGEPSSANGRSTMERSLNLIHPRLDIKHEIIRESEAEAFSRDLGQKVLAHLAEHQS